MSNKSTVLIITPFYLPGNKAGGPIRSLSNIVDRLGEEFDFKIITADRDFQSKMPYEKVTINEWNTVGKAKVFYCGADKNKIFFFREFLKQADYDIIYLNSFFHPEFTISPLLLYKLRLIPRKPLVLAPRGELTPGALAQKEFKKKCYLNIVKLLGLYDDIRWHAASNKEAEHIRRWFGKEVFVTVAENMPEKIDEDLEKADKNPEILKLLFLSRISPKKNLTGALKILKRVSTKVEYDIFGPIEDEVYWQKCQQIINGLPQHIRVSYRGELPHEEVARQMAVYDAFFMPTFGENYGHAIIEALSAGCPVLISDQTPWDNLQKMEAGWSYPLKDVEAFVKQIENIATVDNTTYKKWSDNARKYAQLHSRNGQHISQTRRLLTP